MAPPVTITTPVHFPNTRLHVQSASFSEILKWIIRRDQVAFLPASKIGAAGELGVKQHLARLIIDAHNLRDVRVQALKPP